MGSGDVGIPQYTEVYPNNTDEKFKITKEHIFNWLHAIIIIILIMSVGIWGVGQFFSYVYKIELISDPCQRCAEINEGLVVYEEDLNNLEWSNFNLTLQPAYYKLDPASH